MITLAELKKLVLIPAAAFIEMAYPEVSIANLFPPTNTRPSQPNYGSDKNA